MSAAEPDTTESTTTATAPGPDAFPCSEQPTRVTLHCRTGHYLWAFRNGKVVGRQRRNDKDEFRLEYVDAGIVEVKHHKFGGTLRVVEREDGTHGVVCAKDPEPSTEKEAAAATTSTTNSTTTEDAQLDNSNDNEPSDHDREEGDDDEEEGGGEAAVAVVGGAAEDRQWCFVRGAAGEGGVLLKSLKTGDHLAIDSTTNKVVLAPAEAPGLSLVWDTECVTGELLYMSNPAVGKRIRCDMAGLLGLTDAWKGWEVFRFMETGSHHYVKISSWMHSQWILCSAADGRVTCCSHAESLKQTHSTDQEAREGKRCSQWAVEKAPNGGSGVVLRSKTFGRLLCVKDGVLRTYSPDDETSDLAAFAAEAANLDEEDLLVAAQQQQIAGGSSSERRSGSESLQTALNNMGSAAWWKNSWNKGVKNMNASVRKARRRMQDDPNAEEEEEEEEPPVPVAETLVWQLEAAHRQTYYFLGMPPPASAEEAADDQTTKQKTKPRSIGPFPFVTTNLRQTDKIQVRRTAESTMLCKIGKEGEKEEFIACAADGTIGLVGADDEDIDSCPHWIMDKPEGGEDGGGSVFRCRDHPYYLSYQLSNDDGNSGEKDADVEREVEQEKEEEGAAAVEDAPPKGMAGHFKNPFGGKPEPVAQLVGAAGARDRAVWNLEPAMPRAVSSDKIKTFAIGTSIAVGTTIAMPFALAGASAVLGAVGAETGVLFNVIAAGLTGAEALASVGAIGATAYIVFRPEENSLTDSHLPQDDEEEGEKAWSKRPFCNWRNW